MTFPFQIAFGMVLSPRVVTCMVTRPRIEWGGTFTGRERRRGPRPAPQPLPRNPRSERGALPSLAAGGLPGPVDARRLPAVVEPRAHELVLRQEHPRALRALQRGGQ